MFLGSMLPNPLVWACTSPLMFTLKGFLSKRFPNAFRMLSEYGELYRTLFRDVALSVALHIFWQFRSQETYDKSSHIYWKFADFTSILKGFEKGSLCSMSIGDVRKEFGTYWKCTGSSENLLKEYWKRSESIRHVLRPFWAFGKHTVPSVTNYHIKCTKD